MNTISLVKPLVIVTHPGKGHRDDFLACCLAITVGTQVPIYRRLPTLDELSDPQVWVIDVGGSYASICNNYDHHQFKSSVDDAECALSLVAMSLGCYEGLQEFPWLKFTEILSTLDPTATYSHYKMPMEAFHASKSPIEAVVLSMWSNVAVVSPGDALYTLMYHIGFSILDLIKLLEERGINKAHAATKQPEPSTEEYKFISTIQLRNLLLNLLYDRAMSGLELISQVFDNKLKLQWGRSGVVAIYDVLRQLELNEFVFSDLCEVRGEWCVVYEITKQGVADLERNSDHLGAYCKVSQ